MHAHKRRGGIQSSGPSCLWLASIISRLEFLTMQITLHYYVNVTFLAGWSCLVDALVDRNSSVASVNCSIINAGSLRYDLHCSSHHPNGKSYYTVENSHSQVQIGLKDILAQRAIFCSLRIPAVAEDSVFAWKPIITMSGILLTLLCFSF